MLLIHLLSLSSLRKREGVNREEEKKGSMKQFILTVNKMFRRKCDMGWL